MSSNIRFVAVSVVKDMFPTDTEDGIDVGSDDYERLLRENAEGEGFSSVELGVEVLTVLKIVGSGRLNSDL
jgi:hypothetical protein